MNGVAVGITRRWVFPIIRILIFVAIAGALIKIAFRSFAIRPIADDGDSTNLENDVFIRISDPTEVAEGPQCI